MIGEEPSGLSGGAIAGIVIGCLVVVGLMILCIKGQADKAKREKEAAAARAAQS